MNAQLGVGKGQKLSVCLRAGRVTRLKVEDFGAQAVVESANSYLQQVALAVAITNAPAEVVVFSTSPPTKMLTVISPSA